MSALPKPLNVGALALAMLLAGAALPPSAQSSRPPPEILRLGGFRGDSPGVATRSAVTGGRRYAPCVTAALDPAEAEGVRSVLRRWIAEDSGSPAGGTIRVAFHVITAEGAGEVGDDRLARQIDDLNLAFADSRYRFELVRVDRTESPAWFRQRPGSGAARSAMQALAIDPARHLNIYVCGSAMGVTGWASHPWSAPESDAAHGVVVDHEVLPGGAAEDETEGGVIHQVGHYLGLFDDDDVDPNRVGFSAGQVAQIRAAVPIYRPSLCSAPAARGVAKPEISPTEGAEPEDGRVLSYRGAFPNPFRAETLLRFTLPASGPVSLRIYSVAGQLVRTLVDASLPPGDHSAMFRAEGLPSGAYFAVLRAGSAHMTRTLMLVR